MKYILILFVSAAAAVAQDSGSIRGSVIDKAGIPVADATVYASPINGRPTKTLVHYVQTDQQGRFLIDRLEWGNYGVFAMKEESLYPDTGASLYSDDIFPRATITPSSPVANLRIQIGPKAGVGSQSELARRVARVPFLKPAGCRSIRAKALSRHKTPLQWFSTAWCQKLSR